MATHKRTNDSRRGFVRVASLGIAGCAAGSESRATRSTVEPMSEDRERYDRGLEVLRKEVLAERGLTMTPLPAAAQGDGTERYLRGLRNVLIHSESGLRQVGTKTSETPLTVHVHAALTAGAGRDEVVETLLNLIPYVGYPKVQRALALAGQVFDERARQQG